MEYLPSDRFKRQINSLKNDRIIMQRFFNRRYKETDKQDPHICLIRPYNRQSLPIKIIKRSQITP